MWVLKFHQIINFSQDDFLFLLEKLSFFRTYFFIELHIGNFEVKCEKYNVTHHRLQTKLFFLCNKLEGKNSKIPIRNIVQL